MIWVGIGIVAAVIGGLIFWQVRRRRRARLISLVALVREPVTFDAAIIASVAGKVWHADLGDGSNEGADGGVIGVGILTTLIYKQHMFLINSLPVPYTAEPQKVAEAIPDLRIRSLFLEHRAWFSCDAMGIDGTTSEDDIRDCYRLLGKLFAELLDENCLLIFLPDRSWTFPINDDTEMALRSKDPLKALQETFTVPIIEVRSDDPLMMQAVEKARQNWQQFVEAYETGAGENFSIKAPVTHAGNTEFIWISVTSLEGARIYGELGNEPASLAPLRLGSKVSVLVADLNDWCFVDSGGNLKGGFTIEAVRQASLRQRKTK